MKKVIIMMAALFSFSMLFCGCERKIKTGETENTVETEITKTEETEMTETEEKSGVLCGGWQKPESPEITDELLAMFNKACEGYVGMGFVPKKLVATQVVAGMNYKFLCDGTLVTNPPQTKEVYVVIYRDLKGNCSITNVEDTE